MGRWGMKERGGREGMKHGMRQKERERERERERENSELYYTRINILGCCLFLQSVPANLHAKRLHIK